MSFAALAVGQAGWNNTLLICGLFGAATVLSFAALFWPALSKGIGFLGRASAYVGRSTKAKFAVRVVGILGIIPAIYITAHMAINNKSSIDLPHNSLTVLEGSAVQVAYHDDFKNYLRLFKSIDFHAMNSDRHVEGGMQIIINFEANVEFLAFYIPHTDLVYSACFSIAKHHDELMAEMRKMYVSMQEKGDINKFTSRGLKDSDMIYLYTEDVFDQKGVDAVKQVFKNHHLSVILRNESNVHVAYSVP